MFSILIWSGLDTICRPSYQFYVFIFLRDEQDEVLIELMKEMDSDPDKLEQKFVEMFEQQQEQRLESMDEALRTAANQ